MTEGKTQRHHLVPRFHLRRFADAKLRLAVIDRTDGEVKVKSVKQAGAEVDVYAFETQEGSKSYQLEKALSQLESAAAPAVQRLLENPGAEPSDEDRVTIATFLAFQVARGRQFRAMYNQVVDWYAKFTWANTPRDPEVLKQRLSEGGIEPTDERVKEAMEALEHPERFEVEANPSQILRASMELAVEMGPYLLPREWNILRCDEPLFVTSDQPVTLWSKPSDNEFYGVGLATADEVRFPLDPRHFLVLTPPGLPGLRANIGAEWAPELNRLTTAAAHDWVFAHPEHPHLNEIGEWAREFPRRELVIEDGTLNQHQEEPTARSPESLVRRTVRRLLGRRASRPR